MFFFSSRRRHTRWPRDWSSDVCSSDLKICAGVDSDGGDAGRQCIDRAAEQLRQAVENEQHLHQNRRTAENLEVGGCRSEEHTTELQSRGHLVCRLLLEKKNKIVVIDMINRTSGETGMTRPVQTAVP